MFCLFRPKNKTCKRYLAFIRNYLIAGFFFFILLYTVPMYAVWMRYRIDKACSTLEFSRLTFLEYNNSELLSLFGSPFKPNDRTRTDACRVYKQTATQAAWK
jgi:hypothetical protein